METPIAQNMPGPSDPSSIARSMVAEFFNAQNSPQPAAPTVTPVVTPPQPVPAEDTVATPPDVPRPITTGDTPVEDPAQPTDKQNFAWAQLRHEVKEANTKLAETQKAMEAERARAEELNAKILAQETELAERERRLGDLEDRLGRTNLAESAEFRAKFDDPRERIELALTDLIVDKTTIKDAKSARREALQLLNSRDSDLADAIGALPSYVQGAIYNHVREARELSAAREAALEEWRATTDGLSEAEARRIAETSAARRAEFADAAASAFTTRAAEIPTLAVTDPAFVAKRDESLKKAVAFLRTASDADISKAAVEGMMAPLAYEIIGELSGQIHTLQQQLQAFRGISSPPVRPSAPASTPPPAPPPQLQPARTTHDYAMEAVRGFLEHAPQHLK